MSKVNNLEERFKTLVGDLGLTEYGALGKFCYWGDDGILKSTSNSKDITKLYEELRLLREYLGLEVINIQEHKKIVKKKTIKGKAK